MVSTNDYNGNHIGNYHFNPIDFNRRMGVIKYVKWLVCTKYIFGMNFVDIFGWNKWEKIVMHNYEIENRWNAKKSHRHEADLVMKSVRLLTSKKKYRRNYFLIKIHLFEFWCEKFSTYEKQMKRILYIKNVDFRMWEMCIILLKTLIFNVVHIELLDNFKHSGVLSWMNDFEQIVGNIEN